MDIGGLAAGARAAALRAGFPRERDRVARPAFGRVPWAWADPKGGEATTGIGRIRDGLAATEATGTRSQAPLFGALLAEALALARRTEEGLPPWTTLGKSGRLWPAGTQKFTRFRGELTARLPYPRFAGNLIPRLESSYSRLSR